MKKGVLLARVSTPRQEKEGLSLEEIQLPHMRRYAEQEGIVIVKEFTFSETADDKMRKKFHEMITFAKRHPDVQAVIAYRVDRITRNYRDAVVCDDLRKDYDKELHFVYDRLVIRKDSTGREISDWDTKVYLAKQQINRLRDDAIESCRSQLRMGKRPGKAPIGYLNVVLPGGGKDILPDPGRKHYIAEVFSLYAAGAHSVSSVVAHAEKHGWTTAEGCRIRPTTIYSILNNPFYTGFMRHNGKLYPHKYEKLISRELFDRCRSIRAERFERGNYKPKYKPFCYRGLITCGYCGVVIGLDTKKQGRIRYVQCSKNRDRSCPQPRLHEDLLDNQILSNLIPKLTIPLRSYPQVFHIVMEALNADNQSRHDRIANAGKQLDRSKALIMEAYRDWKGGRISAEHYERLAREEDATQEKLAAQLEDQVQPPSGFFASVEYLLDLLKRLPELYRRSNSCQKLEWHRLMFSNVRLKDKKLLWELKSPFDAVFSCSSRSVWYPLAEDLRTNWKETELLVSTIRKLEEDAE